ncbi:MAG: aspartate ammonia-lyase [Firmicutes bacterium HGW-Firmicutes-1]|jgi:aspartate ammonia-lyase|nr:MAG: aspartate ammonia-lyase [Firmicutes bacterium HGW-Firmicutes-1]
MRIEKDQLGQMKLPKEAHYGIHTARALDNFAISGKSVRASLLLAIIEVKKAAAMANMKVGLLEERLGNAIVDVCNEFIDKDIESPLWKDLFTDAFQGGAGTSTNMNVNEVLANAAIERLEGQLGDYSIIHPINHVNLSQSTNDVYPTALRIAAVRQTRMLSEVLSKLQESLQEKENTFSSVIKLGRTQLMDALPITVGQEFGAWARAISRDRWRIYKVEERLRETNMGGTAVGTGLNAPLEYIYTVTDLIQRNTGLGLCRSDYLMDSTQNMDVFVEVSGLLKALAVNLIKIASDLRLLGSGPAGGLGEIKLPQLQAGSSIMPGKVNPVMCEMITQVGLRVIGNDSCITGAAMMGQLELNAFSPLVAEALLDSFELLYNGVTLFREKCIEGIEVDTKRCMENLEYSSALATALIHHIGYDRGCEIAKKAQLEKKTVRQVALEEGIMDEETLDKILNVYQVTAPGIPGKE